MWWGNPHRIPWLTQGSTNQVAPSKGAIWRPSNQPKQHIKIEIQRERNHSLVLTLSLFSLAQKKCPATYPPFVTTPHGQTYRRRRWRPAHRGGAAFFSGDVNPKSKTSKHEPYFIFAFEFKSKFSFSKLSLTWPYRYSKERKEPKP